MRLYSICDPRLPKQPQGGPGHLANAQRPRQHPTKKRGISKQGTYLATQAKKQLEHSPRDSRQPKGRRGQGGGLWSPPHLEFPRSPHRGRHGLNLMRGAHQGPCPAFRGAGSRAQQRSNVKRGKRGRQKKELAPRPRVRTGRVAPSMHSSATGDGPTSPKKQFKVGKRDNS